MRVSRGNKCSRVEHLHDLVVVPEDGVGVELLGRVEPEEDPLLASAVPVGVNVRLQDDRLPGLVPEELEIEFVVVLSHRVQLLETQRQVQAAALATFAAEQRPRQRSTSPFSYRKVSSSPYVDPFY